MIKFTRHVREQMQKRGILETEVLETLKDGTGVEVREPRKGRRKVFTSGYEFEGRTYPHKEVTVIYVEEGDSTVVLTAIAGYGKWEKVI